MDVLWLMGKPLRYFLVPASELITHCQDKLLSQLGDYEKWVMTDEGREKLFHMVDLVVLVADNNSIHEDWLPTLPNHLARLAYINEDAPTAVRERIKSIGVDGYLSHSMNASYIDAILQKVLDEKSSINQLQEELKTISSVAFTAMTAASEIGIVAVFAEKVQRVMSYERLAELVHSCLQDMKLNGVLQFAFDEDIAQFPEDAPESYKQLLRNALQSKARIASLGRFLLFCFDQVQLLVIDAPEEDQERYGRMRDVLIQLTSITSARAKTIKANLLLKEQQDNSQRVMKLLKKSAGDNRASVKHIMLDLSTSLRMAATSLELSINQENALLSLSDNALNSLESLQETNYILEEYLAEMLDQLNKAAGLLENNQDEEKESASDDSNVSLF
jgi:hypothetical protein